uniref:NAC domain-containing protein n=1 Tax=Oryza brachyantha TaxID=4533 RepID=J3MZ23_ORYBR
MATLRQLPPGFRFHPTDEELVVQYLRRRALSRPLPAAVIPDVHDAAVLDPWDLPGAVSCSVSRRQDRRAARAEIDRSSFSGFSLCAGAGEGEAYFFSFRQL